MKPIMIGFLQKIEKLKQLQRGLKCEKRCLSLNTTNKTLAEYSGIKPDSKPCDLPSKPKVAKLCKKRERLFVEEKLF